MSDPAKRGVLIVEDDPEIQYLLEMVLKEDDRELFAVGTGAEAEVVLARESIDLIVLDLILPDMDGRTLLSRVRERPDTSSVPVVVISARGGVEIRQDCYALGADYFTEKPFNPDDVAADIRARLERTRGRDRTALIDPVTGLMNRAGLLAECDAVGTDFGLALVQLDGFLVVSERWGWEAAEGVLRDVGAALRRAVGESRIGRLGGGDFIVFSPNSSLEEAAAVAGAALDSIRALHIDDPDGETLRLTASVGVVIGEQADTLDDVLDAARRRLFQARESGRNQVVSEDIDSPRANRRVLVAEDDEISATILLHRLAKEGLDVVRYANGREAYEAALEETPALVILDVKMPGMDGFEVLERLRRTPSYSSVPIILLTSMGSEADVVRGFQLGADDYVLKPFSPIELSARVFRLLRRGRSVFAV
ncbi:MAG: response regulator [Gemmatimonadetes bacterium]|nr:response regulator [Gemmatimonadota bacterium]